MDVDSYKFVSDYQIDIVLLPSDIKLHPSELVLRPLLPQFQELMQLAAPPCSPSLPSPLTSISAVHSPVGTRPASRFLSDIRRRGRQ